jgi:hypothetical protein
VLFSVGGSMVGTHTGMGCPRPVDTLEGSWMGGGEEGSFYCTVQ